MAILGYDIQKLFIYTVVTIGLCNYIVFLWKKRQLFFKSWNYPGPLNLPFIGAAYVAIALPKNLMSTLFNLHVKYNGNFKVWFGNRLIYFINTPKHVDLLIGGFKNLEKDKYYELISNIIGTGLLTAPVPLWRRHRKHIAPTFNQQILNRFVSIFAERSLAFNKTLAQNCSKKMNFPRCMFRCMLEITCETTVGVELNVLTKNTNHWAEVFDKGLSLTMKKLFYLWNHSDFLWRILGYERKMEEVRREFNSLVEMISEKLKKKTKCLENMKPQYDFIMHPLMLLMLPTECLKFNVIEQKMAALRFRKNDQSLTTAYEAPPKKLAFLDYLLEIEELSTEEIRNEINVILLATDTTASALTFVFVILGIYPDIQQKVYEEVVEVIGEGGILSDNDLPRLKYTERVIKESLRLFPPASFFLRQISQDVDMGDFILPKGASIFIFSLYMHRNPKYWPDPLRFDPDRFLPEEVAKRQPGSYIPFSYGPRNCIGFNYAMMVMKSILATVIRKFMIHSEYKSIDEMGLKAHILLRFQDDPKVTVTPRM